MSGQKNKPTSLATTAIHGSKLYAYSGPVSFPIYQTSTYRFENSEEMVKFAQGDPSVYVYSRYHNPTVHDVEEKLALMEGAESAALFSSGMAAITTTLLAAAKSGDEIVSTPALYGGTYRFFRDDLPKHGITVKYLDPNDLPSVKKLITDKTQVVYLETPTNPTLDIVNIFDLVQNVRTVAEELKTKLIIVIDNTFATIINQKPFALGVDVIVESATKYLGGHSDILSGVVLGSSDFVTQVKNTAKHLGGCADPFAAYLLQRSLKTFELRVQRQNENALALARSLEKHEKVKRVLYPGLPSHPKHELAKKQMSGFGGMVTFEVKPTKGQTPVEAAVTVCDNLCVAVNAMSLGGVETLVSIPVYSSHIFLSDEELARHGVTAGMVRVSVGVEGIADLIEDFDQALSNI